RLADTGTDARAARRRATEVRLMDGGCRSTDGDTQRLTGGVASPPRPPLRQCGRQLGADERRQPAHIDPGQQYGANRQRTIDRVVGREPYDVECESVLGTLEQ